MIVKFNIYNSFALINIKCIISIFALQNNLKLKLIVIYI